jgi:hypothetical protein
LRADVPQGVPRTGGQRPPLIQPRQQPRQALNPNFDMVGSPNLVSFVSASSSSICSSISADGGTVRLAA